MCGSNNNFCYKAQESSPESQGQVAPESSTHWYVASQRWRYKKDEDGFLEYWIAGSCIRNAALQMQEKQ